MSRRVRAIQLLINSALPEGMRNYERKLDVKDVQAMLSQVATENPDSYNDVARQVNDAGRNAAYFRGLTVRLADLRPTFDKASMFAAMDEELKLAKLQAKSPKEYEEMRDNIWLTYSQRVQDDAMSTGLASRNSLAMAVASGARGKADHFKAMTATPALFADAKDRLVPMFVRNSFGEGLRPAEYMATTYGARKAVVATKVATARGGFFGKLLSQATAPLVVTSKDCGTTNGIDLGPDDSSLSGRVLAGESGGYDAGTIVDDSVLAKLLRKPDHRVLVRSALTCELPEGVCAKCAGLNEYNELPKIGDSVGLNAGHATSEPVTQGLGLNVKHTGGSAKAKKEFAGLDAIERFVQSPEIFPGAAVIAEEGGVVGAVRPAEQGGNYVTIGAREYYAGPDSAVTVTPGTEVEPGEALTDGVLDPYEVVRLRGLGEGRKYWVERFGQILKDSGTPADRRNLEMVARGALNQVVITDPDASADSLPGDVVNYNKAVANWEVPATSSPFKPQDAVGKVLQKDALHYTVGTRLTPRMVKHMQAANVDKIWAGDDSPGFEPEMVRLQAVASATPDWLAGQYTSYIKKNLADHAARGDDTNIQSNVHFAPRLAVGEGYGKNVTETGHF